MTIKELEIVRDCFNQNKAFGWVVLDTGDYLTLSQRLVDKLFKNPKNKKHFTILNNAYILLPKE